MEITFTFIRVFIEIGFYLLPLLLFLFILMAVIGLLIGRLEKWSRFDALYFAFITATTVGFGDIHPKRNASKVASLFIAIIGIIATGLVVAIGLNAAEVTFTHHYDTQKVEQEIRGPINNQQ